MIQSVGDISTPLLSDSVIEKTLAECRPRMNLRPNLKPRLHRDDHRYVENKTQSQDNIDTAMSLRILVNRKLKASLGISAFILVDNVYQVHDYFRPCSQSSSKSESGLLLTFRFRYSLPSCHCSSLSTASCGINLSICRGFRSL